MLLSVGLEPRPGAATSTTLRSLVWKGDVDRPRPNTVQSQRWTWMAVVSSGWGQVAWAARLGGCHTTAGSVEPQHHQQRCIEGAHL